MIFQSYRKSCGMGSIPNVAFLVCTRHISSRVSVIDSDSKTLVLRSATSVLASTVLVPVLRYQLPTCFACIACFAKILPSRPERSPIPYFYYLFPVSRHSMGFLLEGKIMHTFLEQCHKKRQKRLSFQESWIKYGCRKLTWSKKKCRAPFLTLGFSWQLLNARAKNIARLQAA